MTEADPRAIPLDDRGVLLGDGLFETLLWAKGALVLADVHARRMADGAAVLGLPAPTEADFIAAAVAAVRAAGLAEGMAAVRLTLTAGSGGRGLDRPAAPSPRLFATAAPFTPPTGPASLVLSGVRRNDASPISRLKSLAYLDNVLARREASAAGADEAVMLNTKGELACAAAANLFWIRGEVLFTPALEAGCLDGAVRGLVLSAALELGVQVREARLGAQALESADAAFLTNSLMGMRPVRSFEGRVFDANGLVSRLAAAMAYPSGS